MWGIVVKIPACRVPIIGVQSVYIVHSTIFRTTVVVHFLFHRKSVSFQVNRSWTNTSSVTCSHQNSSCSMFVCSHEHFQRHLKPFCFWGSCCLLPNTCFNAVNTQSGHVSFVCVCVYITLYANAAFVQPNAFKYNNTVVLDHVRTWMSTEFQTYLRHLKWYALI